MNIHVFCLYMFALLLTRCVEGEPGGCAQTYCFLPCVHGYRTDENGCPSCSCLSPQRQIAPVCDDLRCFVPCSTGYQLDSNNCLTCTCAPPTAVRVTAQQISESPNGCEPLMCLVPCTSGYLSDSQGCLTCSCASHVSQAALETGKTVPDDKVLPYYLRLLSLLGLGR